MDVPVACGRPAWVRREGRGYAQTWWESGSSGLSNLTSTDHVRSRVSGIELCVCPHEKAMVMSERLVPWNVTSFENRVFTQAV